MRALQFFRVVACLTVCWQIELFGKFELRVLGYGTLDPAGPKKPLTEVQAVQIMAIWNFTHS